MNNNDYTTIRCERGIDVKFANIKPFEPREPRLDPWVIMLLGIQISILALILILI